jgi:plasmid stabilization system protein ParE
MARLITWSPDALQDLDDATAQLELYSAEIAQRLVRDCFARAARLATLPQLGPPVSWGRLKTKGYRQLLVGDYRLLYRLLREGDEIVAITHQHQNLLKIRRL